MKNNDVADRMDARSDHGRHVGAELDIMAHGNAKESDTREMLVLTMVL